MAVTALGHAVADALMSLEGPQCAGAGLAPSGLAAIVTTLLCAGAPAIMCW